MKLLLISILMLGSLFTQKIVHQHSGSVSYKPEKPSYGIETIVDFQFEFSTFLDQPFIKHKSKSTITGTRFYENGLQFLKENNAAIDWNGLAIDYVSFYATLNTVNGERHEIEINRVHHESISTHMDWGIVFGLDYDKEKKLFKDGFTITDVRIKHIEFIGHEDLKHGEPINPTVSIAQVNPTSEKVNSEETRDSSLFTSKKITTRKKRKEIDNNQNWYGFFDKFNIKGPVYHFDLSTQRGFILFSIGLTYAYEVIPAKMNDSKPYEIGLNINFNYANIGLEYDSRLEANGIGLGLQFSGPVPRYDKHYFFILGVGFKHLGDRRDRIQSTSDIHFGIFTNQFDWGDVGVSLYSSTLTFNDYSSIAYVNFGDHQLSKTGFRFHFLF